MNTTRCEELVARDKKVIAPAQRLSYYPLVVDHGEGSLVYDADGNEYIDFLASAASLNLGTNHPAVKKAMLEQIEKIPQYTLVYMYAEPSIEYAEKLTALYPGGVPAKLVYTNCGSDANDAAIKYARAYTGRQKIVVFQDSYHGNSFGALTMTSCSSKMHEKIGPLLPEVFVFPFWGTDHSDEDVEANCMTQLELAFQSYLPGSEVAAVILEPVQGDGGILPAHPIFMQKLYALCKKYGILFISEEVQQGFYRTGKFLGVEHYNIIPDGVILGKTIGGGTPLGAFMGRAEIMDALPAPGGIFTLAGNSLSCAAGMATLDYMQTDEFQTLLASNITLLEQLAADLKAKHPDRISLTRNLGMSMAIGIQTPDGKPDADGVFKILYRCYQTGLVIISLCENILRVQPALNIPPEQLTKGFNIIDAALSDYEAGNIPDEVLNYRAGW